MRWAPLWAEAQRAYVEAHVAKPTRNVSQYIGALTPTQVAEGINAAKRNAKRLAEDAALLFLERLTDGMLGVELALEVCAGEAAASASALV